MNARMRRHLELAKKPLVVEDGTEMSEKVKELEKIISAPLDEWTDYDLWKRYQVVDRLPLEEKRLMLVYSILGGSVNKVAKYFQVDRKTITNRLETIMPKVMEGLK